MILLLEEFVVSLLIHQFVEFCRIYDAHFYNPRLEGGVVDKLGIVFEFFVHSKNFAGHGRIEVARSLTALNCAEFFPGLEVVAFFGHINVCNRSELLGSVFRDTYITDVAVDFNVFVRRKIVDFHGRDFL